MSENLQNYPAWGDEGVGAGYYGAIPIDDILKMLGKSGDFEKHSSTQEPDVSGRDITPLGEREQIVGLPPMRVE